MKVLALDLASTTGWAVLDATGANAINLGAHCAFTVRPEQFFAKYPRNYIMAARHVGAQVAGIVQCHKPDHVVIEETNHGRFTSRFSQKLLEYIHFAVAEALMAGTVPFSYMDTSAWRRLTDCGLTAEQRAANAAIAAARVKQRQELETKLRDRIYAADPRAVHKGAPRRQALSDAKKAAKKMAAEQLRGHAVGGAVRTVKHAAIETVNARFGLHLIAKDNDIADAILLGVGFCTGYYAGVANNKNKERDDDRKRSPQDRN